MAPNTTLKILYPKIVMFKLHFFLFQKLSIKSAGSAETQIIPVSLLFPQSTNDNKVQPHTNYSAHEDTYPEKSNDRKTLGKIIKDATVNKWTAQGINDFQKTLFPSNPRPRTS